MVMANLNGLKRYICERPVDGDVGQEMVKAYPFKGDAAMGVGPSQVVGIDGDNDGRLEFFVGTTAEVLGRFVKRAPATSAHFKSDAWGTPVSVPLRQLVQLTSRCQEWNEHDLTIVSSYVATATGIIMGVGGGLGVVMGAPAAIAVSALIAGALLIGSGIYVHHSVQDYLDIDVPQQTFQSLTSYLPTVP